MAKTVLLTAPYMTPFVEKFRPVFNHYHLKLIVPEVEERMEEEDILAFSGQFDGVICGDDYYTRQSNVDRGSKYCSAAGYNMSRAIIEKECPTCGEDEEHPGECPDGEHMVEGECVPKDDAKDVLESNPGFSPGSAKSAGPEGIAE